MTAMRQLAALLWVSTLSACSLIYNPSNIDNGSMPPDAAIADANPALITLKVRKSPTLLEGAGQGGSAPAILVVYGEHITKNALLTIVPRTNPMGQVAITVSNQSIADDGNSIAALVSAGYMEDVDEAAGVIELDVIVTQDGASPQMIEWDYQPLDELASGTQPAPVPGKLFSHVDVDTVDFAAGVSKAIITAVGEIKISGRVSANASGRAGGAGGCDGGIANVAGQCFGAGRSGGGGGGYAVPGSHGAMNTAGPASGDPLIKIYDGGGAAMNRGGGGGGGDGAEGGGGGGVVELTAGGAITVGTIEAKGAAGGASLVRGAGGGSGGTVVLRAGGTLAQPAMLDIQAGAAGNGGVANISPGGAGAIGRWRFDAAAVTGPAPMTPPPRRGPMIVRPANPIFETKNQTLMITGENGAEVTVILRYADGTSSTDTATLLGESSSYEAALRIGLNTICVLVPGGNFADDVAKNCVEVAFIP
jgi:hypothetical protein